MAKKRQKGYHFSLLHKPLIKKGHPTSSLIAKPASTYALSLLPTSMASMVVRIIHAYPRLAVRRKK